ncbi:pilus assembly protein PilM [Candidatus Curtissbacteria bacterium]|nr:pilus assembly protein PilM [Candidatus Curtissbacteria bacterium]
MALTSYHAFGLHITDSIIKLVELAPSGNSFVPVGYSKIDLAPNIVVEGMINEAETLAGIIRQLIQRPVWGKITSDFVVCSLPESRVFLKVISVPHFPAKQLDEAIAWEARALIPLPVEEAYFHTQIIGSSDKQVEVLLAATEKKLIDTYLATLTIAKLIPVAFDLECNAVARSIAEKELENSTVLQIHIGQKTTTLTVIRTGKLLFSNTIANGITNFVQEVAVEMHISPEQALIEFNRAGILKLTGKKTLSALGNGITSTITFYNSQNNAEKKIERLILAGSSAIIPGLIDGIKVFTPQLPIGIASPRLPLPPALTSVGCSPLQTSLGLAMRGAHPARFESDINFLPEFYIKNIEAKELQKRSTRLLAIFIYVSFLINFILIFTWFSLRKDISQLKLQILQGQSINSNHPAKSLYSWIEEKNSLISFLSSLEKERLPYQILLSHLNATIPSTVKLTNLAVDREKRHIEIQGVGQSREAILAFSKKLSEDKIFKDVSFSYSSFDRESDAAFSVQLAFDPTSL